MPSFAQLPPLALYIHVPWCVRKCPYCDFNSHAAEGAIPEAAYLQALAEDLEASLPQVWGRRIESVFIGGGTPSLMSPDGVDTLLSTLRALLNLDGLTEVTLEANPGTAEQGRFVAYREAGINRLSLGIQSFDDAMLTRIGRIHDAREARRAVEMAQTAGFAELNLDLMFGLPGQDAAGASRDLATAIALAPTHLSYYQLTIEPNTAFAHDPPPTPDDELLWQMQEDGLERLAAAGYGRYEVSAYALEGHRCTHNLNYWQFGDYLGIGAGAHGKLTLAGPEGFAVERQWRERHPRAYMEGRGQRIAGTNHLGEADLAFEFMLNALRLREGFETGLFAERTGLTLARSEAPLARAEQLGLLERSAGVIRPTRRGFDYLNNLLELFLEPGEGGGDS